MGRLSSEQPLDLAFLPPKLGCADAERKTSHRDLYTWEVGTYTETAVRETHPGPDSFGALRGHDGHLPTDVLTWTDDRVTGRSVSYRTPPRQEVEPEGDSVEGTGPTRKGFPTGIKSGDLPSGSDPEPLPPILLSRDVTLGESRPGRYTTTPPEDRVCRH